MTLPFPDLLLALEFGLQIPQMPFLPLGLLIQNMTHLLTLPVSLVVMPELTQGEASLAHGTQPLMTQTSSRLTSRLDAQVPIGNLSESERIFSERKHMQLRFSSRLTETRENAELRPIPDMKDQETFSLSMCKLLHKILKSKNDLEPFHGPMTFGTKLCESIFNFIKKQI